MSKLSLEQLFQQKLNQVEIAHKPEYWSKMEEELETSAPISGNIGSGVGASLSKIYLISGIVTSAVIISIIGYFSLIKPESTSNQNQIPTVVNNPIVPKVLDSTSETLKTDKKINNSTKVAENIAKEESTKSIVPISVGIHKSNSKNNITIQKTNILDTNSESKLKRRSTYSPIVETSLIKFNKSENLVSYNPKDLIRTKFKNTNRDNKETNICNELITIKPIDKPAKKVFKSRHGFLYRLGIRK